VAEHPARGGRDHRLPPLRGRLPGRRRLRGDAQGRGEVDLAVSGEEAFAKTRQQSYALFLVDVEMPGMDGFAFVERARAEPALSGIPSILVTSGSSPEDRARGQATGASGYIARSEFDQADLLERIRKLVG
jgi:two-component system chemotaxis sensor kinase CheA